MNAIVAAPEIDYPSSDGKPMAENTKQWEWIVLIKGNLDLLFENDPNVFVAGDHLIYPVLGDNTIRQAPDVYVAFGRPKGHRGSYRVFEEDNVFPQVIFEILSPGNRVPEMTRKAYFYERYGAEEYYVYDPDTNELSGWLSHDGRFSEVPEMDGYVSPRLGVRFDLSEGELQMLHPDGQPFRTIVEFAEMARTNEVERKISDAARSRAERERDQFAADAAKSAADAEKLRTKLIAAGIDPDAL